MIYLECTCADISLAKWNRLMQGAKRTSYKRLVSLIKKELPDIYEALNLKLPNEYRKQTKETKTHFILVHSAIEYFFCKC